MTDEHGNSAASDAERAEAEPAPVPENEHVGAGHPDPRFAAAIDALQGRRLRECESLIKALLKTDPQDSKAVHLYGVLAHQAGRGDAALELTRRAVALDPEVAAYRNTLGFLLRLRGETSAAIEELTRAVTLIPNYGAALNNLGIAYADAGRLDEAVASYERALTADPDSPELHNNLGNALARSRRLDEAIECYDRAIALRDSYADAWSNKGDALQLKGSESLTEAEACYARAVTHDPRRVDTWLKLGTCRHTLNRTPEALEALSRAVRLNPNHTRALSAYAATLERAGRLDEAASHLRHALTVAPDDVRALKSLGHITLKLGNAVEAKYVLARARELAPADPDTLYSYANTLLRMEQLQPAMDLYLRVRELQPNQPRGTFAPAAVLLMDGQYETGWAAYESRYAMAAFKPNVPNIRERLWSGQELPGGRLLVHVEQGFGDTIQFCRYIPLLKQKLGEGATVILLCEPETFRLMQTLEGVDELHHLRETSVQVVYDAQVPLLSLPHRFGTTLQTIPRNLPYLFAPAEARADWPELPTSEGARLRVAFAWTGRPTHSDNIYRSIPLERLASLFDVEGVDFHSVQLGAGVRELKPYLARPNVFDHSERISDFADTAAILEQVDLLISVDTAVCHLAGAMGRDVWTMLPFGGEWRWLRNRDDTPWYPTMKLARQRILGDWGIVLDRVREGLEGAVRQRAEQGTRLDPTQAPSGGSSSAKKSGVKKSGSKKSAAKKSGAKKAGAKKAGVKNAR
jgi:tetratricopeptide (TPR) repeat protein